ncbi:hypothetical protein BN1058_02196 [Paraliobacillus sp. PM-2]|nr:hypothetical protein BN1058_02196 [Paraliobacillus sp. PM-2]
MIKNPFIAMIFLFIKMYSIVNNQLGLGSKKKMMRIGLKTRHFDSCLVFSLYFFLRVKAKVNGPNLPINISMIINNNDASSIEPISMVLNPVVRGATAGK